MHSKIARKYQLCIPRRKRYSLKQLFGVLLVFGILSLLVKGFLGLPPRRWGFSNGCHPLQSPRYCFGRIRVEGVNTLGYFVKFSDRSLPIQWLKVDRGRLFVNGKQVYPKSGKFVIVFSEDNATPRVCALSLEDAERFFRLRPATYERPEWDDFWEFLKKQE